MSQTERVTAYRPAPTGLDLRLTAIRSPGLPFTVATLVIHVIMWISTHFLTLIKQNHTSPFNHRRPSLSGRRLPQRKPVEHSAAERHVGAVTHCFGRKRLKTHLFSFSLPNQPQVVSS